jgi:CBS domain-containing protein
VAGAAGGMSAVFATPLAAIFLAVELLLFEWKPRSIIPVALSSVAAYVTRHYLLGAGPLFPMPASAEFIGVAGFAGCVFVGLAAGLLSCVLTQAVYLSEDGFEKLPIHWMWWPTLGGVVIGLGGFIFPEALGVGYGSIAQMLAGNATTHLLVGMLLVKSVIWAVSLGSGTSGGVVAPVLLMGGALGGVVAGILPAEGAGFWVLMAMGATFAGVYRAPLTGIVFAFELTHNVNALAPLTVTVMIAHGFAVLGMRRSILTERISRRGFHLSAEYSMDPLEMVLVREVMRTNVTALSAETPVADLAPSLGGHRAAADQRLYPVLDAGGRLAGVISRSKLQEAFGDIAPGSRKRVADLVADPAVVAYGNEPLRIVVYRMAETGLTRLPVVSRADKTVLEGIVSLNDLLKARTRAMDEERHRERVLRARMLLPKRSRAAMSA